MYENFSYSTIYRKAAAINRIREKSTATAERYPKGTQNSLMNLDIQPRLEREDAFALGFP